MRIVAGEARGRRLGSPEGREVRPTNDRVREAVFNALASLDAIVDRSVLDLFAGTGALGLEALSRGARHATFVEQDARTRRLVTANLATTGLSDRATVMGIPAERYLADIGTTATTFDLALLDPPYAYEDEQWSRLLDALPAGIALVETNRELALPERWGVVRSKWYGSTLTLILETSDLPEVPR